MKLVEILARELEEWPDDAECIVQDSDRWIGSYDATPKYVDWAWQGGDSYLGQPQYKGCEYELASDHSTAIITRADWEAERARIKGETKVKPKANKDGWIRHRGGKCPVEAGTLVDVRMEGGVIHEKVPCSKFDWSHDEFQVIHRVMAWRPHKAEQSTAKQSLVVETPAAKQDGPLQWRDRILELDAEQKAADEAHKAATEARGAERADLVAKLKAEGFLLIQSDEPNSGEESAQQDIAQQDMSDPANWRVGDLFEIIGQDSHEFPMGELVRLVDIEKSCGNRYAYLDGSDYWRVDDHHVKWHSRPPQ